MTAGDRIRTIGYLALRPHPWLNAEACRVGLGISFLHSMVGIEDSGAGGRSIRRAGFTPTGMADGNIATSGTMPLCSTGCQNLDDVNGGRKT